jgi:hypothetical protein
MLHNLHTELGLQYLSPKGLSLEFGLGVVYAPSDDGSGKWRGQLSLSLGIGWFLRGRE